MYGINNIRFGGLASGIDTEGIVRQLMNLEHTKLDRFNQQKQLLEWKQADYRSVNNQLRSFREGPNFNLKLQGTYMTKTATTTNDSLFNVTATNTAATGNYTFEVKQLAKGVTVEGFPTQTIAEFFADSEEPVTFSFKGTADGEARTVTVNKTDQMADIANKINQLSDDTGVKALYDKGLNVFFMYTEETGDKVQIEITDDKSGFLGGALGLKNGAEALGVIDGESVIIGRGTNAQVSFNDVDLEFASNKFEFISLNFDLKKVSLGEKVNVQVTNNVDKVVDEIKTFVESYNKIVDDIGNKLTEKRFRDFPPLSEEQKADMKEKDIEKWEEKARSGMFRADPLLSQITSTMRMTMSDAVGGLDGEYKTLSSIGISTSRDWNDNGKLYIDEGKLRAALADDLDGVAKIFNNDAADPKNQGIAQKLDSQIKGFYEQVATTAGKNVMGADNSYLGRSIKDIDLRIETMQNRMMMLEDKYWRQFTAMEKALQQIQSQGDWFAAQLGMG